MSAKDEIIAALKKREDLRNTLNEIYKQRDILIQQIDSCKNDIDLIFDRIQSTDYDLYNKMFIEGRNEVIVRFDMDGELVEVTRDMKYEKPTDRITIVRKPMLL